MGPPRDELETTEDGREICPRCRNAYSKITIHWTKACEHPRLFNHQLELIKGLLCGDGSVEQRRATFRVEMINKRFLEWLDEELGWLTSGVKLARTNEEVASHLRDSLGRTTSPQDAHDLCYLRTRTHPQFAEFQSWFEDDEMRLPPRLSLSKLELKMWYISDGGLLTGEESTPVPSIASHKEMNTPNRVRRVFDQHGFEVSDGPNFRIKGGLSESRRFLEYLGEPPEGFEYKWAIDDTNRYYELKGQVGTQSVASPI